MSPVSFCTFLVVLLVYALSLQSSSAANLLYAENPADSPAEKLEGALLNAVVFVGLIALLTFPLVLLYYYNCTAFLRHYTRFSAFFVLASVGGSILLSLLQRFSTPVDSEVTVTKGNEFEDYFLKSELLMGIYEKGFERPSPIQKESIPIALTGSDILARAEKGPGKTAAFCIAALEKIDQDNNVIQVVILVPTPELALQTSQVCKELGKHLKIQVMVTTGGTSLTHDIIRLYQPVHLLIGTPGRILDLVKKGVCILKYCPMLVMDEADKLLSPEFQPSIEQLIPFLPRTRQIVMFSATFPVTVKDFKDRYLRKPNIINLMDELTLKVLSNWYSELGSWCCGEKLGYGGHKNESRLDGLEKMVQELAQDRDGADNERHDRFQRLEDLIRDLTVVVEKLSGGEKILDESSTN